MSAEHSVYEALICRLPDGDLSAEETSALQAHLNDCAECRRFFRAMRSVTEDLDTLAEPPASLASGVMERVRETSAASPASAAPQKNRVHVRAKQARRRRIARVLAVAACLAVVIGGGAYLATHLLGVLDSASARQEQSVSLDSVAASGGTAPAAAAAFEAAELPEAEEADAMPSEPFEEEALAEEAAPEAAETQAAADYGLSQNADKTAEDGALIRAPEYTLEAPAHVTEGREADFETLVSDAGQPDGGTDLPSHTIAYVEYRGVIYEFLSDPSGETLLWRDAAESVDAIRSPGTAEELWAVIG